MSSERVADAVTAYTAAAAALAELDYDQFTHPELLDLLNELETVDRKMPTLSHRILARLHREASPPALGAKSLKAVLTTQLRISGTDAKRRLDEAAELGPRVGLTGEPLAPVLPEVAAAQAQGAIGAEHVAVIRTFFHDLPYRVDAEVRELAQRTLVTVARGNGPEELRDAARRLATGIDQDGPEPDDADRARQRSITVGRQGPNGMSRITGYLDPQGRATFEACHAKLAAPGMCNPADEYPCTKGTPPKPRSTVISGRSGNAPTTR